MAALAKELSVLGHRVTVLTPRYRAKDLADEVVAGAHILRLKASWKYGNAAITLSLPKQVADSDIVHLHVPFYFGKEILSLLGPRDGAPLVITYHNDVDLPGPVGAALRAYDWATLRRVLRRANLILVPSDEYGKRSRIAALPWKVLPNGVDFDLFRPDAPPAKELIELGRGRHILLFVSTLDDAHDYKGLEDALQAMKRLSNHFLAVVGDGARRTRYEKMAAGLSDKVQFFGRREHVELAGFYAAAAATLYPSRRIENFPLGVLESLACGTPAIVTSLVSSSRTLIISPNTGRVVQPFSPAEIAGACVEIGNGESTLDAKQSCSRTVASYSWHKIATELLSLYEAMLQ